VLILGVANLLAYGFSMAVSNFLGMKTDHENVAMHRSEEQGQIDLIPDGEVAEVSEIFRQRGFDGNVLNCTVEVINAGRELWVNTMPREQHGLQLDGLSARRAGLVTFLPFEAAGAMPLLSYVIEAVFPGTIHKEFLWSSIITTVTFVGLGAMKSRFAERHWLRSGLETLLVGGMAVILAFVVGVLLRGLA
jgi:VIT1/CCC1 family predicted Fe2+/Mn2+ transporter